MAPPRELGFVGLGRMGAPMSRRLIEAGYEVTVFDTNAEAVRSLVDAGATAADSPKAVADAVETVLLSLPTPDVVQHVALGPTALPKANGSAPSWTSRRPARPGRRRSQRVLRRTTSRPSTRR